MQGENMKWYTWGLFMSMWPDIGQYYKIKARNEMLFNFATESSQNLKKFAEFETQAGNMAEQGHRMWK